MGNTLFFPPTLDTVVKRVQYLVEHYPDKELFVFYQGETRDSYTSQQLFQLAGKFANRLRHRYGFKRNDIIVNTLPNSPERLITDLGITLAGCTCMNGQILLADGSDFFRSARNSKCNGVIMQPENSTPGWRLLRSYVTGDSSSDVSGLSCDKAPDMTSAILASRKAEGLRKPLLADLRSSNDGVFVDSAIGPEDLLYIFTTSGSTGYSKLVPRTHAEAITLATSIFLPVDDQVFKTRDDLTLYSDRLLGWPGGYPFNTYCFGDKRVLLDWFEGHGKKTGEGIWKAICREKCTMAAIFPLELDSILKYVASTGSDHFKLKVLGTGAQPIKKSQVASMFTIAEQVLVGYGSTEIIPISIGVIKSADVDDFYSGKPPADVQLKVIDDNGKDCKPRQAGTILAKGPTLFKGYFNRVEDPDPNTAKCFTKDGWYNTEDIGYLDEDGNVYVLGRNKDTIIYGSSVLYPGWLEAKIMQHPDIDEALVLPVSDPVLFHNICACVKKVTGSDLNEEKLETFCESIFVADLENDLTPMPKYFMVFESLPQTATGKPDKQILRRMAEERFGTGKTTSTQ